MRLLVIGGEASSAYHLRQLGRAGLGAVNEVDGRARAQIARWLAIAEPGDQVVPAASGPHVLWDWLAGEVGGHPAEVPRGWGLPFEMAGPAGELYLSAAAWTCPATCVEPAHCPVLHAPRDWDLADIIEAATLERGFEPAVFRCVQLGAGVAGVGAGSLIEARDRLKAMPGVRVVVATSSRCHAALGGLLL